MATVEFAELRKLVIKGDRDDLCAAVAAFNETERKSLADDAIKLLQSIEKSWGPGTKRGGGPEEGENACPNLIKKMEKQDYFDWRLPRRAACVLVAAVCDRKVIEDPWKFGLSWLRDDLRHMPQELSRILTDRRPSWLQKWLEREWRQEDCIPSWFIERELIRLGALPANDSPEYFARMAEHRGSRNLLLSESDPELFEHDVWRLFEVDTSAFRYNIDQWGSTLIELSEKGRLDRQRLLEKSLAAMRLPFSTMTLNGFGKFHEMLKPDIPERITLANEYLLLLKSSQPMVVGHGLKALEVLVKAKKLDEKSYFEAMPNAFLVDKKGQPVKALGLAAKLTKQKPECKELAFTAIIPALEHADPDVQETALKQLESYCDAAPSDAANQLQEVADVVAATLRTRYQKLLAQLQSQPADHSERIQIDALSTREKKVILPENSNIESIEKRAEIIPNTLRAAAQVDAAINALKQSDEPSIVAIHKRTAPRRDPNSLVVPIGSLDELIEVTSANIEKIDDVMELEKILDGVSRFYQEQPSDFAKRTAPLRKRILKLSEQFSWTVVDIAANIGLTQLLMNWLQMPPLERTEFLHWPTMRGWFLRERIAGVGYRIENSRNETYSSPAHPMPVLALPTHKNGWLDPVVLVDRLNDHYSKHHELPEDHDLAQAILRLTPDGREEALSKLGQPDHYNGGLPLRYALGDDCELSSTGGLGEDVLLAAANRARALFDDTNSPKLPLANAKFGNGEIVHVSGAWMADPTVPFSLVEVAFSNEPKTMTAIDPNNQENWVDHWESISNPMDTEPGFMAGYMTHLLDSESTWGYEASRLAIVGASSARSETRVLATDALIEAIARAWVIPETLGTSIANCMGELKLNRVCKVLNDVAQESLLHHWVVLRSLESCFVELKELPKDIQLVLAQMLESAVSIGADLRDSMKEKLKSIKGKSKAGKLASQLVDLDRDESCYSSVNEALALASLDRAERWAAI